MDFRILGPVEAWADGSQLDLGPPKQRCVLASLLLSPGRPVATEKLIRNVWGDDHPTGARNDLYSYLSRLRTRLRAVDVRIISRSGSYTIDVDQERIDLNQVITLRDQARSLVDSGDDEAALPIYRQMTALWRGEPLANLSGEWAERTRRKIEKDLLSKTYERVEVELGLGHHADLLSELSDLVESHPVEEPIVGCLMKALYRSGRQTDALAAYQTVYRRLRDVYGADPTPELGELHQRILRNDPELLPVSRKHDPTRVSRGNLPSDVRRLVGREQEVKELLDLATRRPLDSRGAAPRAIAIDGMPGVGKSALAVHLAHRLAERFPDLQFMLRLNGHNIDQAALDAGMALDRLLRALGIPVRRIPQAFDDRVALWRTELARRRALFILDDAAGHEQVRPLLADAPGCLTLITSRLRLAGLDDVESRSLEVLSPANAARLFETAAGSERARSANGNVDEVVRLCGRLPMAIQLVGNRLRHRRSWSVADLAGRLARDSHRLREIRAENREITAAFEGSYKSLTARQQEAFRGIGMHAGEDFTSHVVAGAIGADVAEADRLLDDLHDRHLVTESANGRFRLHDLIRDYSRHLSEQLDSADDRRHVSRKIVDHYLCTADRADRLIHPHRRRLEPSRPATVPALIPIEDAAHAREWFGAELANLLSVIAHAPAQGFDRESALLVHGVAGFLEEEGDWRTSIRLNQHATAIWRRLADAAGTATALAELALVRFRIGEYGDSFAHAHEALELFRILSDRAGEAESHDQLGLIHWQQSRFDDALSHIQVALKIRQEIGDQRGEATSLDHIAIVMEYTGKYQSARTHRQRALHIYEAIGHRPGLQRALNNMGDLNLRIGRIPAARGYYEKAAAVDPSPSRQHEAILLNNMANIHQHVGNHHEALSGYRKSLLTYQEIGDRRSEIETLIGIGKTFERMERYGEAAIHHQRALALSRETLERYQEAMALCCLGDVLVRAGRHLEALERYRECLAVAVGVGDPLLVAKTHEGMGNALLHTKGRGQARKLWKQALHAYTRLKLREAAQHIRSLL